MWTHSFISNISPFQTALSFSALVASLLHVITSEGWSECKFYRQLWSALNFQFASCEDIKHHTHTQLYWGLNLYKTLLSEHVSFWKAKMEAWRHLFFINHVNLHVVSTVIILRHESFGTRCLFIPVNSMWYSQHPMVNASTGHSAVLNLSSNQPSCPQHHVYTFCVWWHWIA